MENLPPDFRSKYQQLLVTIDSTTGQPVTESLGPPCLGFSTSSTGFRRFNFLSGDITSFDHTGRFPVVCIYGPIYELYNGLGGSESPFGRPLTDVVDLSDGSKCAIFEGGVHIHQWGDKAEPYPASHCTAPFKPQAPASPFGAGPGGMPPLFLQKWVQLSTVRDPSDNSTIIEKFGLPSLKLQDNPFGGQHYNFLTGELVSVDNNTLPYAVLGPIYEFWNLLGNVKSGWGRPIADEQYLQDGSRCSVFEGGHIHCYGDVAKPFPAENCTARYKPMPRSPNFNTMPAHFQRKWSQLAPQTHPHTGRSIAEALGVPVDMDNNEEKPGQYMWFTEGFLVSLSDDPRFGYGLAPAYGAPYSPPNALELTPPFAVYGDIYQFWLLQGGWHSIYGRPICDEQSLPDGGRCSIFEGGHIHLYNGKARGVPDGTCQAPYQPQAGQAPSPPTAPYQQPYQPPQHPPPSSSPSMYAAPSGPPPSSSPSTYAAPSGPPPSSSPSTYAVPSGPPPQQAPAHHTQMNYHQAPPAQPHQYSPMGSPAQSAPTYQPPMSYQQPPPQLQHQQQNAGNLVKPEAATGCLAMLFLCLCCKCLC